jgi:regulatory protein
MPLKSQWTEQTALDYLRRWCVQQDRCQSEIRAKLIEHGIFGIDLDHIISLLISDGFIHEERYARNFCRGKFRMLQWGKIKIRQHLKFHQISAYCIRKGMSEISDNEYMDTLRQVLRKKWNLLSLKKDQDTKKKLLNFGIQKGFESNLIYLVLEDLWLE